MMSNPENEHYLGYVEFIHTNKIFGRIRPLAILGKSSTDNATIATRACDPDELGSSGLVYWIEISANQDHLQGQYVKFKVEQNRKPPKPQDHGDDYDQYLVASQPIHGNKRKVSTDGLFPLLPENQISGHDLVLDCQAAPNSVVYRGRKNNTVIDGPWRVVSRGEPARLFLEPKDDGYVLEFGIRDLIPDTYHFWFEKSRAVLLVEPPRSKGKPVDLMPASDLSEWLVRVLKRDKSLLTKIDNAVQGWRNQLAGLLELVDDTVSKRVNEARLSRLNIALDALSADEARLSDLVESPRFKTMLDAAISREVASAGARIEETALEEKRVLIRRLGEERERAKRDADREKQVFRDEVDKARVEAEREIQTFRVNVDSVRAEIVEAESLREAARLKVRQDESSIRAAADYLVESRERIIRDFAAFQALIEGSRGTDDSPNAASRASKSATSPLPFRGAMPTPDGTEIDVQRVFLKERLAPALAAWGAEVTFLQVKRLHAGMLACRWVAVPCPSWGVAYAEATGNATRHRVITVEPTWLTFSDSWNTEVESFWREAVEHPDILHILIFADANRALIQCWARPLLDLVSGLRSTLPSGDSWPDNLRLMACPSPDNATLPVPDWVAAHWAGIKASKGATRSEPAMSPGYVSYASWSHWRPACGDDGALSVELGAASRSAAAERSILAEVLRALDSDGDPDDALRVAVEIRESDARSIFARDATQ